MKKEFMKELWKITKEEAIWSFKTFFAPVTATFRFLKKLWKDKDNMPG